MADTSVLGREATLTRAVVRLIEPGSLITCAACGAQVKFSVRTKARQVICNVYDDDRWLRVEHYHQDCYQVAGDPHGPPDSSQLQRPRRRAAASAA